MVAGTQRLDLYDFFSVFIPGAAFIVGLVPFLPAGSEMSPLGAIVPTVVGGYVIGRGFHSLAAWFDASVGDTHRTRFFHQIQVAEPSDFDTETRDRFLRRCNQFLGLQNEPTGGERASMEQSTLTSLYVAARSAIHIDGRGRSRTFQAVYAFHRSMWVIVVVLGLVYLSYAVVRIEWGTGGVVTYRSMLRDVGIDPLVLFLLTAIALSLSFATFRRSKTIYRRAFVQYFVADFLAIEGDDDPAGDTPDWRRASAVRHDTYHGAFRTEGE